MYYKLQKFRNMYICMRYYIDNIMRRSAIWNCTLNNLRRRAAHIFLFSWQLPSDVHNTSLAQKHLDVSDTSFRRKWLIPKIIHVSELNRKKAFLQHLYRSFFPCNILFLFLFLFYSRRKFMFMLSYLSNLCYILFYNN